MSKHLINTTAAHLNVHPLVAIRFLITGTTACGMFSKPVMRQISKEWKAYQK